MINTKKLQTYIKMVAKLEDPVFDHLGIHQGDTVMVSYDDGDHWYVYYIGDSLISSIGEVHCVTQYQGYELGFDGFRNLSALSTMRLLPSLDQLLEVYGLSWLSVCVDIAEHSTDNVESMEEIVMTKLMRGNYYKKWNGEEWVKLAKPD